MTDERGPVDLQELAGQLLGEARSASAGRSARTLPHPVDGLRQTVVALRSGAELSEHESPGAASLQVLQGRVRLLAADQTVEVAAPQITPIPDRRHSLATDEDSVVLLSVAVPFRSPEMD